ncbi:MAG: DNA gyrase C-terminal beta-propeller domain-containing protein, partial [Halobacteriales archaeon]
VNIIDLDDGEEITAVVTTDDFDDGKYLAMATRNGYVKRTAVEEFENILSTGIIATRLEDDDALVDVVLTDGTNDLVIATKDGMSIRFDEDDVRPMGRSARGVYGIDLEGDDAVIGLAAADEDRHSWLLSVTENGYGKRTDIDAYRRQSRNGKGLIDIKTTSRNGPVCAITAVSPGDQLLAMSESGQVMRIEVEDISIIGRNTQGVIVMDTEDVGMASVDVIPAAALEETTETAEASAQAPDD